MKIGKRNQARDYRIIRGKVAAIFLRTEVQYKRILVLEYFSTFLTFRFSVILSIFVLVNHLFARILISSLFSFLQTASFLRHESTSENMSSAEEESFIILEDTPSLAEPYSILQIPKSIEHNSSTFASIRTVDLMDEPDNSKIGVGKPIDENQSELAEMSMQRLSLAISQTKETVSPNLAESFLLGAIDRNTMMVRGAMKSG